MIDWKDCIVKCRPPEERAKRKKLKGCRSPYNPHKKYVWVAYSKENPYLPIAIADTASDLEEELGLAQGTVTSSFSKYNKRIIPRSLYHRVEVGDN